MRFTKSELQACIAVGSRDESRLSLMVVRFEAECIVATDGHRIVRIEDPDRKAELDEPFSISLTDAKHLAQMMEAKGQCAPQHKAYWADGKWWRAFVVCMGTCAFAQVEGDAFPDYRSIPTGDPKTTVIFDARYLKAMCEAAIKVGEKAPYQGAPMITIEICEPPDPVVFKSGAMHGIVVPLRG